MALLVSAGGTLGRAERPRHLRLLRETRLNQHHIAYAAATASAAR
jgi:hypothetical protein